MCSYRGYVKESRSHRDARILLNKANGAIEPKEKPLPKKPNVAKASNGPNVANKPNASSAADKLNKPSAPN